MRVIPKDKVISHFHTENKACYTVADGEAFWVEADDCYLGQIKDETVKRPDIDVRLIDCAVGPIDVAGAMPGDTLCVEVLAIELAPQGVMPTAPGLGVLGDQIKRADTKIIPVHDGFAWFSDGIRLPLTPMIGVMGVAPKQGSMHCAIPGDHGANMDTKLLCVGAKAFFPVAIPGGGLAVGDIHACMGDGELSGTGIEIAGRMCLRTTVRRDRSIARPVIETDVGLYFLASRRTLEESIRVASEDTVRFLMCRLELNFQDAYRLMSAVCDAQICEVVDENVTVRIHCPKFHSRVQMF